MEYIKPDQSGNPAHSQNRHYSLDSLVIAMRKSTRCAPAQRVGTILLSGCAFLMHSVPAHSQDVTPAFTKDRSSLVSDLQLGGSSLDSSLARLVNGEAGAEGLPRVVNGAVAIEALAVSDPNKLLEQLRTLGIVDSGILGSMVSGWLPVSSLVSASRLSELKQLRPSRVVQAQAGLVPGDGDQAMKSDQVRRLFQVDGSGVSVGAISNSYDLLEGESTMVMNGELPGPGNPMGRLEPVTVLDEIIPEDLFPGSLPDEGRAMLEIVHDVAPGASLLFSTGIPVTSFVSSIGKLADAGADIIVDDLIFFASPWFQQDPLYNEIRRVTREGVTYFSAAGNAGTNSYESRFRPTPPTTLTIFDSDIVIGDYILHDFNPSDEVDAYQPIDIPAGGITDIFVQWDDPFASVCAGCPGADTEIDIFFALERGNPATIIGGGIFDSVFIGNDGSVMNGDAVEAASLDLFDSPEGGTAYLMIGKRLSAPGPNPDPGFFKWIDFGNASAGRYATNSSTIVGFRNAPFVIAVGASEANDAQSQLERGEAPEVRGFSSRGRTPFLFDAQGNRLTTPLVTKKPDVVGPDNVRSSFFGFLDESTGERRFPGTSAAAPNIAGAAALLIESAKPNTINRRVIRRALRAGAVDMDDPKTQRFDQGFDFATGTGFVDARKSAVFSLVDPANVPDPSRFFLPQASN